MSRIEELKREVGYSEDSGDPEGGSVDALIAYKDALEDELGFAAGLIRIGWWVVVNLGVRPNYPPGRSTRRRSSRCSGDRACRRHLRRSGDNCEG